MRINITFHVDHIGDEARMRRILSDLKMKGIEVVRAKTGEMRRFMSQGESHIMPPKIAAPVAVKGRGRPNRVTEEQKKKTIEMLKNGVPVPQIREVVGISEPTIYMIKTKARHEGHSFPETERREGWHSSNNGFFGKKRGRRPRSDFSEDEVDPDTLEEVLNDPEEDDER